MAENTPKEVHDIQEGLGLQEPAPSGTASMTSALQSGAAQKLQLLCRMRPGESHAGEVHPIGTIVLELPVQTTDSAAAERMR